MSQLRPCLLNSLFGVLHCGWTAYSDSFLRVFVRQEFRLESYMTFPRGHWLDRLELLLAHLGDEDLTELQALVSGFVPGCDGCCVSLPPNIRQRKERE